ncbi:protein of unknown function [Taphrina deformans PYCC 5710]|uniref:tRNA pseudouridine synthase 1 n=1 Tax=Taphrina deformans (strain PYCC 5710 / ATCC 11124 / CBS 356.35 / IMI 108563 / JCM 9778 / NBRC 8474) TaxID=1097556 RepID=R4XMG5_TAPDE|nr:protein of unknown function [Taphrina deformans PYCC 5710]|eukprot:CCG84500.1 protein of unknown function [Taphrina deformans PYCC 5710]
MLLLEGFTLSIKSILDSRRLDWGSGLINTAPKTLRLQSQTLIFRSLSTLRQTYESLNIVVTAGRSVISSPSVPCMEDTKAASDSENGHKKKVKRGNNWDDASRQVWEETKRLKTVDGEEVEKQARKPKRKVACLIGYCGTGFHGMQLNPPNRTIESTLFEALVKCGAVSADNADDPKKVSFLRAARTDKGVHAAVNAISLKMIIDDPQLIERINSELPGEIRVWKITRTMKSFNPRTSCDSRVYEYLIPTSAFLPPADDTAFASKIKETNSDHILKDNASSFWQELETNLKELKQSEQYLSIRDDDPDVGVIALDSSVSAVDKPAVHAQLKRSKLVRSSIIAKKRDFRISSERLQIIRNALQIFLGTKNFHNYTLGQTYNQPNSKRVIKSFVAGEPFLINGTEWLSLKVHGQSFMLHQIRKMVAMVLLVVRSSSPLTRMEHSFEREKINIPKAPSLGLLLERPIFDVYNRRAAESTDKTKIELGEMDDAVNKFKMSHVYDKIYAEEDRDNVFHVFLSSLDAYASAGEFSYLFGELQNVEKQLGNEFKSEEEEDPLSNDTTLVGEGIEE